MFTSDRCKDNIYSVPLLQPGPVLISTISAQIYYALVVLIISGLYSYAWVVEVRLDLAGTDAREFRGYVCEWLFVFAGFAFEICQLNVV